MTLHTSRVEVSTSSNHIEVRMNNFFLYFIQYFECTCCNLHHSPFTLSYRKLDVVTLALLYNHGKTPHKTQSRFAQKTFLLDVWLN